ncbi:MAG: FAD-linked oxidase C-terminal domain-containing protein [Leeuwenhoekiella sp.]
MTTTQKQDLTTFSKTLDGKFHFDKLHQKLYATDGSVYRKIPLAVAFPKDKQDLKKLIAFAKKNQVSLIPRTAGTSLAGQVVGDGIIVDVSKHFTEILSLDEKNRTITVQPGIIRDDLNRYLEPFGLFFGPNTSTSNRCMIGGMVGNNSSGTTSIQYGVTRDKVIKLETILSDGNTVVFEELSQNAFTEKTQLDTHEGEIYRLLKSRLETKEIRDEINKKFPDPAVHRRNTGYALDAIANTTLFEPEASENFNLCKLLTGSEGTLAFTTEITLQLDPLPPEGVVMVAAHFASISACLQAVVPAMEHNLYTCEMMDKVILDCTLNNREYLKNRFFIEGDPAAILMFEVRDKDRDIAFAKAQQLVAALTHLNLGYAFPILQGNEIDLALNLRKAGLGLLGNMVGDRKAVACIEDTAVPLHHLANYIEEFTALMTKYNQQAVYYAHAGAGELHLRPILDLKKSGDVHLFKEITEQVAILVKKYKGAMSGEHGNGIVRSGFIPELVGEKNYALMREIKSVFDPEGIFNPGKIVDPLPMTENLRYQPDRSEPEVKTLMDFSDSEGILRLAEKCNGSGDCRKPVSAGGTMCPSYRATRNEMDTTRGRANALREFLTHSEAKNRFSHRELKDVFDLCISCKACASECPSNVDVATLKAEFEYQYKKENGSSLRSRAFAYNSHLNKMGSLIPFLTNTLYKSKWSSNAMKRVLHIAKERDLPPVAKKSLQSQIKKLLKQNPKNPKKSVYLFVDEFTNYLDVNIGKAAIGLLQKLNYEVRFVKHPESGRSFISKGFLKEASRVASKNVRIFKDLITTETPLLGIEPSAILGFRDEYPRLVDDVASAKALAANTFLIDEFLLNEIKAGQISADQFSAEAKTIKIHGHCHQKALSSIEATFAILNLPKNFKPTIIPSGCCGMAGSFGYEKEHYDMSMQIGEQTLFPAVRKASVETIIIAPGSSCRQQIVDGTGRKAVHWAEVLLEALV